MSVSTTSKKRPSSVSSRNRSSHLSQAKSNLSLNPARPSFQESKPDFRVYNSASVAAAEEITVEPIPLDPPGEDLYAHRSPVAHRMSQRTSSFSQQNQPNFMSSNSGKYMSEPVGNYNMMDSNTREGIFQSFHQEFQEDTVDTPAFGLYQLSENPEMNEVFKTLESRFLRMEKRLETNENLIHLHDEMQRLNHLEKRNMKAQEENIMHDVSTRLSAMEQKINLMEGDLRTYRSGLDQRMGDFTKKIEKYLDRFVATTAQLGQKFDMMASGKDKEGSVSKEKVMEVEGKLEKVAEETRERLKTLYETVENVGKLAHQTANGLESEKYNVKRLEDDFLRLLSTSKDLSQSSGDVKWLSEELYLLKNRQVSILNYLNVGMQNGDDSQINDTSYKR